MGIDLWPASDFELRTRVIRFCESAWVVGTHLNRGGGALLARGKTVPPAHVWCATERKFFFEKSRRAKGRLVNPVCSPAPSTTAVEFSPPAGH
jgi:hypothetical protein